MFCMISSVYGYLAERISDLIGHTKGIPVFAGKHGIRFGMVDKFHFDRINFKASAQTI
jgi:hypothetical protein